MKVHERTPAIPDSLLLKLTHAVLQGAALASLAVAAGCAHDNDGDEPMRIAPDSGRHMDASAPMRDSGLPRNDSGLAMIDSGMKPPPMSIDRPTEPYPLDVLGCSDFFDTDSGADFDMDGGFGGQCCVRAGCYTPPAGEQCASAKAAASLWEEIPNLPAGSGTCACRPLIAGPYAPNPEDAVAPKGECCYTFGVVGCLGRPLTVQGAFVIAPLAARSDWAPFA